MKLSDLAAVDALAGERSLLIQRRDGEIGVTIDGWSMQREFVDVIAIGIRLELRHRIAEIDAKLIALGVEIS